MEDPKNIVHVCSDCMSEKKEYTQRNFVSKFKMYEERLKSRGVPVYIKAEFRDPHMDRNEYMWVAIQNVNYEEQSMTGLLENEPSEVTSLKHGDVVHLRFHEVVELMSESLIQTMILATAYNQSVGGTRDSN